MLGWLLEQLGEIEPGTCEALRMGWEAIASLESIASIDEEIGNLDDPVLNPAGQRTDLTDPSASIVVGCRVDHQVQASGHGRYHEVPRDVLTSQQGQGAQFRDGFAGTIGM
jgi:hypothetical protein